MNFFKLYCLTNLLLFTACRGNKSNSDSSNAFSKLSDLPNTVLTPEQKDAITHDCTSLGEDDATNSAAGCILFSMTSSTYMQSIGVDEGFSEQDLIERLTVFFEDISSAPTIIIEGDGLLEDGLSNPGFNIILR